ncbi:hypothetical protein GKZ68_18985 [Hymenobacter sp. BRD128]|uniref:hypothetical protein n=1 Tax=Hymenobacter sp. BRD128 TaxID=2675878 RepID=UPI001565BF56|nr:hypothetical protein [Hymenobacter sp. BRD128]QKG58533.1 hypothetical protein GKZ68_18985 [Hymenobacter sp. BRD128]
MKRRRWLLPIMLLALLWVSFSRPTYAPPVAAIVRLRLNYLERVIREGSGPATTLGQLGTQNPEWALFTRSFTTYGLANLAAQDSSFRREASEYIGLAIRQVLSSSSRLPFGEPGPQEYAGYSLPSSVLYLGHLNLMLGCHRQLAANSPYRVLHDSLSAVLYRRYAHEPAGNLESYPGLRWLPDNTVALASLALHSRLTGSRYAAAGRRWVAAARTRWLAPATGLLASQVDARGQVREGPRGSMLGWGIWFIARFDSVLARQQYQRYQASGSTNLGVLRLYREWPGRYATTAGDVDSGPLLLGYGISATTTAFADAVALRDWRNAQRLRRVISLGSREIMADSALHYGVRFIDLDASPLSEALLLWADVPASK